MPWCGSFGSPLGGDEVEWPGIWLQSLVILCATCMQGLHLGPAGGHALLVVDV